MKETIKQLAADGMLRGSYAVADETERDSPLQVILELAWRQVLRNNRLEVAQAATEELG